MRLFINFTAFGKIPAEVSGSADVATRLGKKKVLPSRMARPAWATTLGYYPKVLNERTR